MRRQLDRLKNPATGEIKLVRAYSAEWNRLKRYGWQPASLEDFNQWRRPLRREA